MSLGIGGPFRGNRPGTPAGDRQGRIGPQMAARGRVTCNRPLIRCRLSRRTQQPGIPTATRIRLSHAAGCYSLTAR
jgi:hypothetical protein